MEKPTKILSDEHQNILKIINTLTKECTNLKSGKQLDKDFFTTAIDFIRNYADKFHHAKEEDILFVEMCKDEAKIHCNPTQQMLYEHDLGRDFIKKLGRWVEEDNNGVIIENARGYAHLLQEHIFKEENILYPMADEALKQKVKNEILEKFKQVEQRLIKEKEKHLLFLEELRSRE